MERKVMCSLQRRLLLQIIHSSILYKKTFIHPSVSSSTHHPSVIHPPVHLSIHPPSIRQSSVQPSLHSPTYSFHHRPLSICLCIHPFCFPSKASSLFLSSPPAKPHSVSVWFSWHTAVLTTDVLTLSAFGHKVPFNSHVARRGAAGFVRRPLETRRPGRGSGERSREI